MCLLFSIVYYRDYKLQNELTVITVKIRIKGNRNSPFRKIRVFAWIYSGNSQKQAKLVRRVYIDVHCTLVTPHPTQMITIMNAIRGIERET